MRRYAWTIAAIAIFLLFVFGGTLITLYTDWLWFNDLGFGVVFSKTLVTRIQLGLLFGLAFFLIVYANLWLARYIAPPPTMRMGYEERLGERFGQMAKSALGILLFLGSLVVAAMVGLEATTHWDEFLRYINASSFGVNDPVFGRDVGFYVFQLPFLKYLYGWLFFTFFVATIAAAGLHYADEKIDFVMNMPRFAPGVKAHLSVLVAILFFLKAWGYYLNRFDLLTTQHALFDGAAYTDVNARLPMLWVLMGFAILGGVLSLLNAKRRGIGLAIAAFVILIGASFLFGSVYPNAIQQFSVKPNEQTKETPYMKRAIEFTRRAYKVDAVEESQYTVSSTLSSSAIANNPQTIQNIRLWDYRPLLASYNQLQAIQQYYSFADVDIDRYTLNGRFRQIMLSAREMMVDQLNPNAQTWVNQRLVYTHGYGLAASPVSEVSQEGLPILYVKDMPVQTSVDLEINRPEVYFGERTDQYVIIGTRSEEFNYPSGDQAVRSRYQGDGGVRIGSFFRRLLFTLRFSDINIILNSDVQPNSRILFRRNIQERASTLLPFLVYDKDPYLVVSGGKLYWFQDAYTLARSYPYSAIGSFEFANGEFALNYIRNSIKVVTDAYTGEVTAYISDPDDAVVKTYAKIFPGVMKPMDRMPQDLRAHIRYPEDLFTVQSMVLSTYHMTDPAVFYNRGDQWEIPKLPVNPTAAEASSEREMMEPNYTIMRLPDEPKEEMLILTPLTRANKDNMVAWLSARNDPEDFGRLILYQFPKGQLVYGPSQIQARVRQDPRISQLLTLWSQQGSQVVWGALLAIPIENTIMYVQSLYLRSTGTNIPELKRVIVAVGNKIAMGETLGEALNQVTSDGAPGAAKPQPAVSQPAPQPGAPTPAPAAPPAGAQPPADIQRLIEQANQQLAEAERRQRAGDWAGYGESINELRATLRRLEQSRQTP